MDADIGKILFDFHRLQIVTPIIEMKSSPDTSNNTLYSHSCLSS